LFTDEDRQVLAELAERVREVYEDPMVATPRDCFDPSSDEAIVAWAYVHGLLK